MSRSCHNSRRRPAVGTLTALLVITLASCGGGSAADVVVSVARPTDFTIAPAGTGPVMAGMDQAVVVERRATVTSVDVVEGAQVQQGQVLLSAYTVGDSGAIGTAENQLRADEKQLESVRARDGVGAASTIALLGQVAADRQALTELKSTPLAVTSPAEGRISGLSVQVGAEVTRTDVVMHIVDDRTLRVTVPLAAAYRTMVSAGQKAILTLPGGSGRSNESTVVSIGPSTVDETTHVDTVPVTVELPNPADPITLGTTAYVRFSIDHSAAVSVNSLAVLGVDQQPFVFVVQDGSVHQRPVVTGVSDGSSTEILSGLADGEEVVISGGQQLITGDPVNAARSDSQ